MRDFGGVVLEMQKMAREIFRLTSGCGDSESQRSRKEKSAFSSVHRTSSFASHYARGVRGSVKGAILLFGMSLALIPRPASALAAENAFDASKSHYSGTAFAKTGLYLILHRTDKGFDPESVFCCLTSPESLESLLRFYKYGSGTAALHVMLKLEDIGRLATADKSSVLSRIESLIVEGEALGRGTQVDSLRSDHLTETQLVSVLLQCPNLKRLSLWNIETNTIDLSILTNLPALEVLSLRIHPPLTPNQWRTLCELRSIRCLQLSACAPIEAAALTPLPNTVRSVTLSDCFVTEPIANSLNNIENLTLRHCDIHISALPAITMSNFGKSLALAHCRIMPVITHAQIDSASFQKRPQLESLTLRCGVVPPALIESLTADSGLRSVAIVGQRHVPWQQLASLPVLEQLTLEYTTVQADVLTPMKQLRSLALRNSIVKGVLPRLERLEELDVSWSRFDSLRDMFTRNLQVSKVALQRIALDSADESKVLRQLTRLTELDLAYCQLSDKTIENIAELPHLTALDLTGVTLTARQLKRIVSMASLRSLSLCCSKLDPESIVALREAKGLTFVNLADTECGPEDVMHLSSTRLILGSQRTKDIFDRHFLGCAVCNGDHCAE